MRERAGGVPNGPPAGGGAVRGGLVLGCRRLEVKGARSLATGCGRRLWRSHFRMCARFRCGLRGLEVWTAGASSLAVGYGWFACPPGPRGGEAGSGEFAARSQ